MQFSSVKSLAFIIVSLPFYLHSEITGDLRVCALMVEFKEDNKQSTTGNGKFLNTIEGIDCESYHIDPPPHDGEYFHSQLKATNSYFRSVSYDEFGIDTISSIILPIDNFPYELPYEMSYYYPYGQDSIADKRLTELYIHSLEAAYGQDAVNFSDYDLIIVFHAGIGQDFSLPFLDPTPEDIPSTFIDTDMIYESIGSNSISIGNATISKGVILPESQNHLNFDISNTMFAGEPDPCDYQFGLNGTLSLMIGFAVGLPPMWDIDNGKSRIGVFGLMDQGSNNGRGLIPSPPDPWSRIYAGWDHPAQISSNSQVTLPKRSKNNILKVDINEFEYFLVENRNNHYEIGVSIDSLRYKIYKETDEYPSFIKTIIDSIPMSTDDNGVITKFQNYDLGLPGSGLLIWHIDNRKIDQGMSSYKINENINHMGVDLEESDGAQDIGFDSFFMFDDPSSGYFGDMWFAENREYYRANPQNEGELPSFTPATYPNTNSNDGSSSNLSFEHISSASDTMSVSILNDMMPYGFNDSTANYRLAYSPQDSDNNIIIGGRDSLWFMSDIHEYKKTKFHHLNSYLDGREHIELGILENSNGLLLQIYENAAESVNLTEYKFSADFSTIEFYSSAIIDSNIFPTYDEDFSQVSFLNLFEKNSHKDKVFSDRNIYEIDKNNNKLISRDLIASDSTVLYTEAPSSLIGVDLTMDAIVNPILINENGVITAYDSDLHILSGFPLDNKVSGIALSKDIIGSESPEIIVKSQDSSKLYIYDNKGHLLLSYSMSKNDDLVFIHNMNQKNYIFTKYSVIEFDKQDSNNGNSWTTANGSFTNSRKVDIPYTSTLNSNDLIIRSYCYPNPVRQLLSTKIRVETFDANHITVNIYDSIGSFIKKFEKSVTSNGFQISEWDFMIESLEAGIYFGKIEAKSSNPALDNANKKLIKIAVIK